MAGKPLLKDLCRANKGNNSSRRIAELTGVPEATVNGFFAKASKDPSVYTVGPICRVCNVSLDEYFGIEIPDKTPENEHRIEVLEHDNAAVKRENELLERSYEQHRRALRAKDRLIYCLTFVAAMAIIALVPYLRLDIIDPGFGLWRGGPSTIGAVVILALTAGVAANIYLFIDSRASRRNK